MAKKIVWSKEAVEDIISIVEFIEKDSEYYATTFANKVYEKAGSLGTFYRRGRIVPEIMNDNMREIFLGDYRLIYKIEGERISIIAVIHGSRDLNKILHKKSK